METPSQFIQRRLEETGMSQKQLAEKCGVSTPQLSQWVNGHRVPNMQTMQKVCEVLGSYTIEGEND